LNRISLNRTTILFILSVLPTVLFCSLSGFTFAQQFKVKNYTEESGLQSELVKSLAVDSLGFIWAGTDFGLIRFNGKDFEDYTSLVTSNYIKSVFRSKTGRLFVTNDLGFEEINYDKEKVTIRNIAKGSKLESDSTLFYPKQIYEDRFNNIWFSDNAAVYQYKNNQLQKYYLGPENTTGSFVHSFSFFEFGENFLLMVSYTGNFYRYNYETDQIVPVQTTTSINHVTGVHVVNGYYAQVLIGHDDMLGALTFDENGNFSSHKIIDRNLSASSFLQKSENEVFIGTWNKGLWVADFQNEKINLRSVPEMQGNGAINQIIQYNSEYILGTDYGIAVLSQQSFLNPFQNITDRFIQDIEISQQGNIYFSDGNNIFRTNKNSFSVSNIFTAGSYLILQILPQSNALWFSDDRGTLRKLSDGRIVQTIDLSGYGGAIYDLISDEKGNIWLCMDDLLGVIKIDRNTIVTHFGADYGLDMQVNFIKSYFMDSPQGRSERLVLGTGETNKNLYYFNKERSTFINMELPLVYDQNSTFSINDLVIDGNQVLWMATNQGVFMRRGNDLLKVSLEFQTNRDIKAITLDKDNNVWFASSTGVSKYDGKNVIPFDHLDGLPSKTISYRTLKTDFDNRIWAGTLSGISFNHNKTLPRKTSKPLFLSISERGIPVERPFKNSFNNLTYLGFSFVSPEYPTDGIQYMVKMTNKDDDWKLLTAKSEIFYTDLDKGEYQFIVKARQRGNYLWSDPLVFNFSIHRVWYQNWLYWLLFTLVLTGIFFQLTKWRNIRLEKERIKLNDQVRERTMKLENTTAEIEAKNKQLLKAKEDAERSSRAKADFLSTMSHETRTPLNGVLGMINILLLENPREDQLDKINTMKFSAENLLALINDILDFNKIDEGKLELENIKFNLKDLANNVKSGFMPTAASKSIGLYLDIRKNVPDVVVGDPTRLAQLLTNLLGNAIKFTEKGEVRLVLESRELRDGRAELVFKVIDTGIGISPDKLQHIFESFSQASSDTTRKYGGSGLGLAISKKLLELMGSRIQVKSKQNVGSEFSFKLIFDKVEEAPEEKPKEEEALPPRRLGGLRILLVEDNMINTKIAKQILEKWEIEVDTAEDGQIAIDKFVPGKYDLILMDLHMPNVDGFTATRAIRERDTNIPIVALTAAVKIQDKDKVLEAGMNEFVSKPFKPKELHELIKSLTGLTAEGKKQTPAAIDPAKRPQFESLKGYKVLLVEDNDINIKIAKQFLEKWDLEVDVAKDGQIAVDMFEPDKYHLILMDLHLPNMDGYEATELIRKRDKNIPIIALTAAAMVQEREKVLAGGMNDFITKPFKPKDLYNKITNGVLKATLNEG
jgi:signal transduction histidine kinase/CheY-like chemotaxis protein/ligand-binding sensor domain-containing protein